MLKAFGAWFPSFCARAGTDETTGEQMCLYPTPVCQKEWLYYPFFFFSPVGSWHETIGKSLMLLYFFRIVSLDSLWLCYWEYATGIFWDERCCGSAICCFCCLNLFLSTGIYTGLINRLSCPSRDSSPLLLQNTYWIPVATAYTAMLQLVQSVSH